MLDWSDLKEQIDAAKKKFTENRFYSVFSPLLRGVCQYAFYALMCITIMPSYDDCFQAISGDDMSGIYPFLQIALEVVLLLFMLNSVLLTFALYHRSEREAFLTLFKEDRQNTPPPVFTPRVWQELGTMWILFLLFPTLAGYTDILSMIPILKSLPPIAQKGIVFLIFAFASFVISFRARIEARKYWRELPETLLKHKIWISMEKKLKKKYSTRAMLLRLIGSWLTYRLLLYVMLFVVLYLTNWVWIIFVLAVNEIVPWFVSTGLIWTLPILFPIWFYFYFLHKRIRFIKHLKKTCKQNHFKLLALNDPYRSVFRESEQATFSIGANGKIYDCRVIFGPRFGTKLIFSDDGSYTRIRALHMMQPHMVARGGFAQMIDRGNGDDRELLQFRSSCKYTFESKNNKVLLINPVRGRVISSVDNVTHEMDNGDKLCEYTFYTGNAFLRLLERESMEKRR